MTGEGTGERIPERRAQSLEIFRPSDFHVGAAPRELTDGVDPHAAALRRWLLKEIAQAEEEVFDFRQARAVSFHGRDTWVHEVGDVDVERRLEKGSLAAECLVEARAIEACCPLEVRDPSRIKPLIPELLFHRPDHARCVEAPWPNHVASLLVEGFSTDQYNTGLEPTAR